MRDGASLVPTTTELTFRASFFRSGITISDS